jgi:hypothetical protein
MRSPFLRVFESHWTAIHALLSSAPSRSSRKLKYSSPLDIHPSFSISHIIFPKTFFHLDMVCWKVCCSKTTLHRFNERSSCALLTGVLQSEADARHSGDTGTSNLQATALICGRDEGFVMISTD